MQILSFLFFLTTLVIGVTVLIAEIRMGADRILAALAGQSSPTRIHRERGALDAAVVMPIRPRAVPRQVAPLPLAA